MEEANADGRMPGKLRKRDILRSYCGRFIVSLISTEDVEQLHNVLPSYYGMDSTQQFFMFLTFGPCDMQLNILLLSLFL
jgi:hypothetical protein